MDFELNEGTEVEIQGLQNDVDLNGRRGFVSGQQRAPDGEMLIMVRLESGHVRLIGPGNLGPAPVLPMPDLSGTWGSWYAGDHIISHIGDRIKLVNTTTAEVIHGTVSRTPMEIKKSPKLTVKPAHHSQGWRGPMDDDEPIPPPLPYSPPTKKKRIRYPWETRSTTSLLTIQAMGTSGRFDGKDIYWKTGSIWKRRCGASLGLIPPTQSPPTLNEIAVTSPQGDRESFYM